MQVFRRPYSIGIVGCERSYTSSYRLACLHLNAVIHDAIFAATSGIGEGDRIFTNLQPCIEEICGIDIMTAAVNRTTIDAGIIDAWLPGSTLRAINFDGNRGTCGTDATRRARAANTAMCFGAMRSSKRTPTS